MPIRVVIAAPHRLLRQGLRSLLNSAPDITVTGSADDGPGAVAEVRALVATYRDAEDLINIGAYVKGSNPKIDRAIDKMDTLNEFFRQAILEQAEHEETIAQLREILKN